MFWIIIFFSHSDTFQFYLSLFLFHNIQDVLCDKKSYMMTILFYAIHNISCMFKSFFFTFLNKNVLIFSCFHQYHIKISFILHNKNRRFSLCSKTYLASSIETSIWIAIVEESLADIVVHQNYDKIFIK